MELSAEQNAMLERLCRTLMISCTCPDCLRQIKYAMRELLLAVQERDAEVIEAEASHYEQPGFGKQAAAVRLAAKAIRAQTYADLFLKEE